MLYAMMQNVDFGGLTFIFWNKSLMRTIESLIIVSQALKRAFIKHCDWARSKVLM